jgi:hypothetical protein
MEKSLEMSKSFMKFAALLVVSTVAGCYKAPHMDYSAAKLVPAYGVVTLDQQPLSGATVVFETPDKQFSLATTDAEVRYALQFDSVQPGVTPGQKEVRISTSAEIGEAAEATPEEGAAPAAAAERVPPRYNRDSELTANVTPDQTEYNFDLTSN